ncbi:MAG TPA: ribosome silencing factor [Rhodospirillales bacterium]|jgi:ribosome-associated protein|nr:ribosome silencing factor [Rhodospirillales bacterium]
MPPSAAKLLKLVENSLDDDKALEVIVIDIASKTDIADFMIIASGSSRRQVGAMTEHLRVKMKASGLEGISVEGAAQCDWVLIDAGDVVVHLFRPEVREFYCLEKMWGAPIPASRRGSGMAVEMTA